MWADLGMGGKINSPLNHDCENHYYVCFLLFLKMNGMGDSTQELIPTRKPSKLVLAAGSTGAH